MKAFRELLTSLIDLFYIKPIRKLIPLETFRYAAVGGINMGFNTLIYVIMFHCVLKKADTSIFDIVVISAPIMAFGVTFVITFFSGFWLTRSIAFKESELRGRTQIFRYIQIVILNIAINYFGINLLVNTLHLYPTPSYLGIQIFTVALSYVMSKYYTFK